MKGESNSEIRASAEIGHGRRTERYAEEANREDVSIAA